jgi:ArsR family transcriptional regulator, virulence genes transcriptional regulator
MVSKLQFKERSKFLGSMANPQRMKILEMLSQGEITVTELATKVGLSQSALSQHLAILRSADMVTTRREAQTIVYSVTSPNVLKMLGVLRDMFDKQ